MIFLFVTAFLKLEFSLVLNLVYLLQVPQPLKFIKYTFCMQITFLTPKAEKERKERMVNVEM